MQPAVFAPTRKAASGRLDPQRVALFGPSVVTQVQRPDPRAGGARGVARPKPGQGRGAGPSRGDVTSARMAAGVLKPDQACLPECNQQPSRPLRRLLRGGKNPPLVALFGPSVVTQVQQPEPWGGGTRGVARHKPGPGRGAGPAHRDVSPGRMAAAILKPAQGCLPECNQQPSRPLRKAASGRLDPTGMALFGPSVVTQVQRPDPRDSGAMGMARPKPGLGRLAGPNSGDVTPSRMAARVLKRH